MEFSESDKNEMAKAIRIGLEEGNLEIGWVYLYILGDDSHSEKYGYISDLFIHEEYRKDGNGTKLIKRAIERAEELGCYKLLCTSRDSRGLVDWYEKLGFRKHSNGFRMDFYESKGKLGDR